MYCNSKWNMKEQNFDVSVNWTLSSNVAVNNIDYFEITSRQLDGDGDYIVGSSEGLDDVQSQVVIQFNLVLYMFYIRLLCKIIGREVFVQYCSS